VRKDALRKILSAVSVGVLWLFTTLAWTKIASCEAMLLEASSERVPAWWLFPAQRSDLELNDVEET